MMDSKHFEELVRGGENAKVDFKATILHRHNPKTGFPRSTSELHHDRVELGKDCAALANTSGGAGYLLLGVNDDGTYADPVDLDLDDLYQIVASSSYPPVHVVIEDVFVAGGNRIAITVPPSRLKPHRSHLTEAIPRVPIRRGRVTGWATPDEIVAMAHEGGRIHFDGLPVRRGRTLATIDAIDRERIAAFEARTRRPLADPSDGWNPESSDGRRLIAEGLFAKEDGILVPTTRCLLVFGHYPQDYLAHATIFAARYASPDATDRLDVLAERGGNLEQQVLNAVRFLRRNIFDRIPELVLRESIVNALIHRDYFRHDQEVVIQLYPTELRITSPGTLVHLTEEDLLSGRVTASPPRRNPGLVNLLYDATLDREEARLLEREGRGYVRMLAALSSAGLPLPTIHSDPDRNTFTVTIHGDFSVDPYVAFLDAADLTAQQRAIAEWLRAVGSARIEDLTATDRFGSGASLRRHLNTLERNGIVTVRTTVLGEKEYHLTSLPS
jgi:ATP-dependent DNA helicase RecG